MKSRAGHDDRPGWAIRIRAERQARGWSQVEAVNALRAHSTSELPSQASLVRNWKRWESGEAEPDEFYRRLVAKTFGTVTAAFFPRPNTRQTTAGLLVHMGMDTVEILARLRASDVDATTLEALRLTADRLCSEYPYVPSDQLLVEGRTWLRHIIGLLDHRLSLAQHREVLVLAGWLALLVGCVEYDTGARLTAEGTRRAAMSLGTEAEHPEIMAWAYEMNAWYALTQGNYGGALQASEAGQHLASGHSVAVQLAAQKAKAWARIGDRREVEVALEQGRSVLDSMEPPGNLDHHFVVDPSKFDFYTMDCYRVAGEDRLAEAHAHQVITSGTEFDGTERTPMRNAEARITLGVVAARQGDLDAAVLHGRQALTGNRKSLPSLVFYSQELGALLKNRFPDDSLATAYLDELRAFSAAR